MKYRKLGKTGITVSEIGFGAWGIGGATAGATSYGETDDAESLRALGRALESGINFYDTSNIYGDGHSEELLGKAFVRHRDKVVIATKVGLTKHDSEWNILPSYIRASLEASLRRLKTDYVDLLQFHSVPLELVRKEPSSLETMKTLKKEGKIRAIGYSVKNPEDAIAAIEEFGVDVVQVNFNMTDQRAITLGIFDAVREKGTSFIARTPLSFGFLSGKLTDKKFSSKDHRSTWSKDQLEKWKKAPDIFSFVDPNKLYTPAQLALKFCLAFKEVSTTIPGMLTSKQVEENSAASDLPPLTEDKIKKIEEVCRKNNFFIGKK